jgi:DNA-binding transcriptional regulator YiaG
VQAILLDFVRVEADTSGEEGLGMTIQRKKTNKRQPSGEKRLTSAVEAPRAVTKKVVVRDLRKQYRVNRHVFSRLSMFSERAIAKWEAGEPLSAPSQQRMTELERLLSALGRIMNQDFIGEWLQTPNDAFDGLKPLEVIERGQIDRLWRMVHLVESGAPS